MELVLSVTLALLIVSLVANVALFLQIKRLKRVPPPQQTYDVTELLHDLTAGQALVKIIRINPTDIFLRSPRGIS